MAIERGDKESNKYHKYYKILNKLRFEISNLRVKSREMMFINKKVSKISGSFFEN